MWADAVRDGVCDLNPWTNLRLETPKGRKDIDALTEQQIAELADLAAELSGGYATEAKAIILTLAYTGMRPGELCALRKSDVDLQSLEVVVQRSLDGTGREKAPKNGLARRIILPAIAAEAIALVPEPIASPYLFHTIRGHRLTKGRLAYFWRTSAPAGSHVAATQSTSTSSGMPAPRCWSNAASTSGTLRSNSATRTAGDW